MRTIPLTPQSFPRAVAADEARSAVEQLREYLVKRTDTDVVLELLEDELRQGLRAAEEVREHFQGILDLIGRGRVTPIALLDAREDGEVRAAVDVIDAALAQLRRRLSQVAVRVRR